MIPGPRFDSINVYVTLEHLFFFFFFIPRDGDQGPYIEDFGNIRALRFSRKTHEYSADYGTLRT